MNFADFSARVDEVISVEKSLMRRFKDAAEKHKIVARRGKVVVYIEDDPDQVSMLKTMMGVYSRLTVLPASNPDQGKALINATKDRVKCVILDLSLGAGSEGIENGMEMLGWLKETHPTVPVLVLTCYADMQQKIKDMYPGVEFHVKAAEPAERLAIAIAHKMSDEVSVA